MTKAWLVPLLALGAAAFFAVATVLQFRTAGEAPDASGFRPRQMMLFMRATIAHPLWLTSVVADLVGLGFHVAALRFGSLVVVQTLLVTNVVFAFILDRAFRRQRPSLYQVVWAAALTVGIGAFLGAAGLSESGRISPDATAVPIAWAACIGAVAICFIIARGRKGELPAATLGVATGVAFAGTAALIKASTDLLARGFTPLFTNWPLYALAVVGVGGILMNQLALQAGPLSASIPLISTVDPLVSVILGAAVLDEPLRSSAAAISVEGIGLALAGAATVALTRRQPAMAG